ncbi:30S ribosomal protein S20 [Patescibacteria group bacterium]
MPIIKSAIKKMQQDRSRTIRNAKSRRNLREILKKTRLKPTKKTLTDAFQVLDKAAKKNIIHANKANRLKANLSKLVK